MRHFISILAIIVLAVSWSTAKPGDDPIALRLKFNQIASGHSFERPSEDRVYTAVIWDDLGLKEFLKTYGLPIEGRTIHLDGHSILIVGFSDTLSEAVCDGFSRIFEQNKSVFYLDLRDTGAEFKRAQPGPGKKYSSWVLVSVPRPEAISHVQVREGVTNKLCKQFGKPPAQDAGTANAIKSDTGNANKEAPTPNRNTP